MNEKEIDGLEVGDVFLYGKRKTPRVVRRVVNRSAKARLPKNSVSSVVVAIKKCSWTQRCETYIDRWFLKTQCELTPMKIKLDSPEDLAFDAEWDRLKNGEFIPEFDCCDSLRELPL